MNRIALLLTSALMLSSAFAWASPEDFSIQTPPAGERPLSPADRHARPGHVDRAQWQAIMQARFEQQQQTLHTLLALNSSQEAAWQSYQAQLKSLQTAAKPPARAALKTQDTLQRLDTLQAWEAQRAKLQQERAQAIRSFYTQLTDAQKKIFDVHGFPHSAQQGHDLPTGA